MNWIKASRSEVWMTALLAATMLFGLGFLMITNSYLDRKGAYFWDEPVNQYVGQIRNPVLNRIMLLITLTGNWQMIVGGGLLGAVLLVTAKQWRNLTAMIVSVGTGITFVEGLKLILGRERPPVENALIGQGGFSFPSGHGYFAMGFYGLLVYFWYKHFRNKAAKSGAVALGVSFILLLAFSRVYLGVHWMTDVLAGLTASGTWLAGTIMYLEYRRRFFTQELRQFNREKVWRGFWTFLGLWTAGLAGLYLVYQERYQL